MRAAKMKERPSFQLMCQTDVQNIYHMQMPRWLFSDPRYCEMSLDAKVAYTFLLNRFQLSRRNGWINEHGEVFVIFPRKALAKELRICEQRVTAAFKKLVELKLVWEKRCGRGDANQIYLARVTPMEDPVLLLNSRKRNRIAVQEPQILRVLPLRILLRQIKNRRIRSPRTTETAIQEPQILCLQNRRNRRQVRKKKEILI